VISADAAIDAVVQAQDIAKNGFGGFGQGDIDQIKSSSLLIVFDFGGQRRKFPLDENIGAGLNDPPQRFFLLRGSCRAVQNGRRILRAISNRQAIDPAAPVEKRPRATSAEEQCQRKQQQRPGRQTPHQPVHSTHAHSKRRDFFFPIAIFHCGRA
jgi:hypothetical protein